MHLYTLLIIYIINYALKINVPNKIIIHYYINSILYGKKQIYYEI